MSGFQFAGEIKAVQTTKMASYERATPAPRQADYQLKFAARIATRTAQGGEKVDSPANQFSVAPQLFKDYGLAKNALLYVVAGDKVFIVVTDNDKGHMMKASGRTKEKNNRFTSSAFEEVLIAENLLPAADRSFYEQKFTLTEVGKDTQVDLGEGAIPAHFILELAKDGEPEDIKREDSASTDESQEESAETETSEVEAQPEVAEAPVAETKDVDFDL